MPTQLELHIRDRRRGHGVSIISLFNQPKGTIKAYGAVSSLLRRASSRSDLECTLLWAAAAASSAKPSSLQTVGAKGSCRDSSKGFSKRVLMQVPKRVSVKVPIRFQVGLLYHSAKGVLVLLQLLAFSQEVLHADVLHVSTNAAYTQEQYGPR